MHIILTTNFSPWSPYSGGGQRSTHNLATALANRGHRVDVIYTKTPFENIDIPRSLPYTLHWALIPSIRSKRASWLRNFSIFAVRKKVKKLMQDQTILHSNGEEGALLSPFRNGSKAFVLTPRYPNIPDEIKYPSAALYHSFMRFRNTKYYLLGKSLTGADLCAPTSQFALKMLQDHYRFEQARKTVIPNGVNELFLNANEKQNFNGPLIFFGRLAYSKGVDTLIHALSLVKRSELKLMIVGRGEMKQSLLRQAKKVGVRDQITWKAWMSQLELREALVKASFAVLPSREESFGNTMAEAMATGTPVISTTAGSIPEVVVDGQTGLLVTPDDPQKLSNAIKKLSNDHSLAHNMAVNGCKRVKEHFTWNAVAQAYEEEYKKLLE